MSSRAGLAPYPSPEARDTQLAALAAAAGGECLTIGTTHRGRPIRAARVPASGASRRGAGGASDRVLVCAGIHGLEYIGCVSALALLERLAAPAGALARLRERAEVWVVPSLNPDGYARTWEIEGEGSLDDMRTNARGVDLNRNYPLPAPQRPVTFALGGWRTGSAVPGNAFYRGTHPLSEPETAALAALHAEQRFAASANLHSTWGTLLPPLTCASAHQRAYRHLCRVFAASQRVSRYKRLEWASFDRFIGEQEDYQHHVLDAWALCIEHYPVWRELARHREPRVFWHFNPRAPERWIANDVPGIAAFLNAALDLGRPSRHAPNVSPARV